jgi:glyoxylase-like metal-dependent hydrolase (beta-lactamase superfamily II)
VTTPIARDLWTLELPNPGGTEDTVNAYLVRDRRGYTLLDSGQGGAESWAVLLERLGELRVPLEAIHTVVASHSHPDHAGAAVRLQREYGAELVVHEREVDYSHARMGHTEEHQAAMGAWLRRYGFPDPELADILNYSLARFGPTPPLRPDRLLAGGETLEIGNYRFEVLWTPGHTPGHIGLHDRSRRWLFCGDTVLPGLAPNVSVQPFTTDDPLGDYAAALRRLVDLEPDLTLPGHGGPMADLAGRVDYILQHQRSRREQILALLTPTPLSPYDLGSLVWPPGRRRDWSTFTARLRRNAVGTLAAHLERLAAEGLIARHDEGVVRFSRPS